MTVLLATITEDLDLPDKTTPRGVRAIYELVGTAGDPIGEAYDADDATILSHVYEYPDEETGVTSVELVGNDDITPAGTAWRRTVLIPHDTSPRTVEYIAVPTDGGTYLFIDLLVDAPGTVESGALAVHKTQLGVPGGHLPLGDPDVGDTTLWDPNADEGAGAFVYGQPGEVVELPRFYHHEQPTVLTVWPVPHNLGYFPSLGRCEDSAGTIHQPTVIHIDVNNLELHFVGPTDGTADFS